MTSSGAYDSISTTYTTKGSESMATSEAQKRANAKWDAANCDKVTLKLNYGTGGAPTKDAIRAAAERDGMSVNAWIIEAIKAKL